MAHTSGIMRKLQMALKSRGVIVTITQGEFYSDEQDRFIKMYKIKQGKDVLINTASQIKCVELLANMWEGVKDE